MNILLLGPERKNIIDFLMNNGEKVTCLSEKINLSDVEKYDFIISYGYRHIIKEDVIRKFKNRIINFHISYLPWNKGADPNLWSFLEDTPKGVSIHLIDNGLDTGEILLQKEVIFHKNEDTLSKTYNRLSAEIEKLFVSNWEKIKNDQIIPKKQKEQGSFHFLKDKEPFKKLLVNGWETKISDIIGKALSKEQRINEK